MDREHVVRSTAKWTAWWIEQRKAKLRQHMTESMSVNPFLLPILYDLHCVSQLEQLFELTVGSHLMTGHNTGFGKLIDEKVLPNVFQTTKLDAAFRRRESVYRSSCFDEIDHLVHRPSGGIELLSLKAGRWTIQLTMAVQLNKAFEDILTRYPSRYEGIVVGVFYGRYDDLTDKYDILRGINRGKNHDVTDLTDHVHVYAGRDFWTWLNEGQTATQHWILAGIRQGLADSDSRRECDLLLQSFKDQILQAYSAYELPTGDINWEQLLTDING